MPATGALIGAPFTGTLSSLNLGEEVSLLVGDVINLVF